MKRSHKAAGIFAALSLGLAAAVLAHPGGMEGGMGMGMGMGGGMGHATKAGMGHGPQRMTPEERSALREQMRSAQTPEERRKLAEANRAEMEKRANESDTHKH